MTYLFNRVLRAVVPMLLAACVWSGCSGAAPDTAKTTKNVIIKTTDEPEFEVAGIHILPTATDDGVLPFVSDEALKPLETPCLKRNKKATQWSTANRKVRVAMQQKTTEVSSAILNWLRSDLMETIPDGELHNWRAGIYEESMVIRHFNTEDIRFTDTQTCITDTVHTLALDQKMVTTLFGVTGFSVISDDEMDLNVVKELIKAGRKRRVQIKPVPTYPKARDENNKLMFRKGKALYVAPNGTLVTQDQVPPLKKRPVFELQVTAPKGVYIAAGDMPESHLVYSAPATPCQINLIFDDMTPRVPECLDNNQMGFGVGMGEGMNDVIVKVATADGIGEKSIPFDDQTMVQAGGTGFAWITPRQMDAGAILEVQTLVLHSARAGSSDLQKFKYHR